MSWQFLDRGQRLEPVKASHRPREAHPLHQPQGYQTPPPPSFLYSYDEKHYGPGSRSASPLPSSRHLLPPPRSSSYLSERSTESHGRSLPLPHLFKSGPERDDFFHNIGPPTKRKGNSRLIEDGPYIRGHSILVSCRGLINLITLLGIVLFTLAIFISWPVLDMLKPKLYTPPPSSFGTHFYNTSFDGRTLIDQDTPASAQTKKDVNGDTLTLVFSDEFDHDGRTFWPGEDPYWEAADLHYWGYPSFGSCCLYWYDPSAITTKDGYLVIDITKESAKENHNLKYKSGMLQSWNKLCVSSAAYVETSVLLPGWQPNGTNKVTFWASVWMLGNLGRAGYGATTYGSWPYTYDSCDVGTVKNQSLKGVPKNEDGFSYQPGQKLSACTCPGEDHPGPKRRDGTFVGRGAPEMDLFESDNIWVTQSAQFAPFNADYKFAGGVEGAYKITDNPNYETKLNAWLGNSLQQTTSSTTIVPDTGYERSKKAQAVKYGLQYSATGDDDSFIAWTMDDKECFRVNQVALAADSTTKVSQRQISKEPFSFNINAAISAGIGTLDTNLVDSMLPTSFKVDYIRVYQKDEELGCDPVWAPTAQYIKDHIQAYTNPNVTDWEQAGFNLPKNRLVDSC